MIDQFILDNVFNYLPNTDERDAYYWVETRDRDGYIVYWPSDGQHFHTNHYPPDWL